MVLGRRWRSDKGNVCMPGRGEFGSDGNRKGKKTILRANRANIKVIKIIEIKYTEFTL